MLLLRSNDLREIERLEAGASPPLMERAGLAAAKLALERYSCANVLVLAGPGNNGGDGFVMARELGRAGCAVTVLFSDDAGRLPADAAAAYTSCRATSADLCTRVPDTSFGLVVDALFGIGLSRDISGEYAELIERTNAFAGPVMALDVPSGLDADTGTIYGCAVVADLTATFIAGKPGLLTANGPDHAGEVVLLDLDLALPTGPGATLEGQAHLKSLPARRRNSHKGSFGTLAVIGGASGMTGAALLAGRAGLHVGAGRLLVGMLEPLALDPLQPELMLRSPAIALANADVVVAGPGLGQSGLAVDLLRRLANADFPVLLDADALNLLAIHPVLAHQFAKRSKGCGQPTLLTPHPTEAARLLGCDTATVQADRITAAIELARRLNAVVALKGCGTVLANPEGLWRINTTGNPGLASAGTGDVLAGLVGGLLAQGMPAWDALGLAVHLHGAAADRLVAEGIGPIGLCAGELLAPARCLLNEWIAARQGTPRRGIVSTASA